MSVEGELAAPHVRLVESPLGPLALAVRDGALTAVRFDGRVKQGEVVDDAVAGEVVRWLAAYFHGEQAPFSGRLAERGTDFQRGVWAAVSRVSFGTTTSYANISEAIGAPTAVRAVGAANGANPWPLIVPCHRVVGADGALTGYVGGSDRKAWLLKHEGALLL